jgi:predicted KAP-like P-loop ATPase
MIYYLAHGRWEFYGLHLIKIVPYLSLFWLVTLLNLIFYQRVEIKNYWPKPRIASTLFNDRPVSKTDEDQLGYSNYAVEIASKIKTSTFETAFAIGINANWGVGKSTFFNFLKKNLEGDNETLMVEFNPWGALDRTYLIQDFFATLGKGIQPYYSSLAGMLKDYSKKLVDATDNQVTKTIHFSISGIFGGSTLNQIKTEIDEALGKLGKKLVIFIDDVDRMDSGEVVEVLKLIRNTADFRNTFFIVAYDRNYVSSSIKTTNDYKPQLYLEKIFQLEITLPYFEKSELVRALLEKIRPLVGNELDQIIEAPAPDVFAVRKSFLEDWLTSMRDVTRLANAIAINYPRLKGNVVIRDFINMEMFRLKFPSIYQILYRQTDDYLTT